MNLHDIKDEFTFKELVVLITALDVYFGFCGAIKRDVLEEMKGKLLEIIRKGDEEKKK